MLTCPTCSIPLKRHHTKPGIFWVCPTCNGRAIALDVLRKVVPPDIVNQLWIEARMKDYPRKRPCPVCRKPMEEILINTDAHRLLLDICTGCFFIWFDPQEFEGLPKLPDDPDIMDDLPLHAREKLARAFIAAQKFEHDQSSQQANQGSIGEMVQAAFGFPVEYNSMSLSRIPFVTWGIVAVMTIVFFCTLPNLASVIGNWGLIPDQLGRHGGLTFITSFFLHAGLWHLVGNMYFMIVFGDNTEDVLGPARYLLLLGLAACAGHLAHILLDPRSSLPCVGASGGISGVMTYYCLRFPRAQVGMLLFYRYYRMPVGVMLLVWIIMQIILLVQQSAGLGTVSAVAHLGGAAVGVFFWLLTRMSFADPRRTGYDRKPEQTV